MRISDWSSDVCSSDLTQRSLKPKSLAGYGGSSPPAGTTSVTFKEFNMATSKEQIQMIEAELQAIWEQITRLKAQEEVLLKVQRSMSGLPEAAKRMRAPTVKTMVLDIMADVGEAGATLPEVVAKV